ncbi:MAG: RagB/SusD family nutrient uptake outer membrane protein [Muribaculaceae bacterium]|nr:RagB/SusD family nutrient uptake outer membrane protein [Muribaculaceae bacterium]
MKPYKLLATAALLGFTLTGCDDFLEVTPEDKLIQDNYYTSREAIRDNTKALYSAKVWRDFHMNFHWKLDELVGDMYYTYDAEGQWYFGTYTDVNQYLNEGWKGIYNVVSQCNSVIMDMPGYVSGVAQEDVDAAIAEARAIRAYCYWYIAECWHDAPIITHNSNNIQNNIFNTPRNPQADIYRFALEDADWAIEHLPDTDADAYRATKATARAIRARILVTMASHSDYNYDRADLYSRAAADALAVIESRPNVKSIPFATLFDEVANDGPESLLAIQCGTLGYGTGNSKTIAWGRGARVADGCWGSGKGPTISLQSMYDQLDQRRKWTYMSNGDYYPNLDSQNGGYTYFTQYYEDGEVKESRNEMNAHIKKYVIGRDADGNGTTSNNQDASNNIYLLRLADMYLIYAEAIMGTSSSTSDTRALDQVNSVRERAGLPGLSTITYTDLLKERRREFAFESINWFDILRLRYREGDQTALEFLNSGYGSGYNRASMYVFKDWDQNDEAHANLPESYKIVSTVADGGQYDPIVLSASAFVLPIPSAATTSSPALLGEIVNYY